MCIQESIKDKIRRRDALRQRLNRKAGYLGREEDLDIVRALDAEIANHEQSLTEIKKKGGGKWKQVDWVQEIEKPLTGSNAPIY